MGRRGPLRPSADDADEAPSTRSARRATRRRARRRSRRRGGDARARSRASPKTLVGAALPRQQRVAVRRRRRDDDRLRTDRHAHAASTSRRRSILAQAMHGAASARSRGVVVNLLDQKLFNPNPDFLSYTLSKAALESATTLLARALAPKLRVVGIAPGITLPSGDQTQRRVREGPRADAARPLEHARRHRRCRLLPRQCRGRSPAPR